MATITTTGTVTITTTAIVMSTKLKTATSPTGFRVLLKSKIHRATLTGKELDYEGSIALDRRLMDAADLLPGEQVHVLNVNTGSRLVTYVIEAPAGSGTVMLNGPAARLGEVGDVVVILAYGHYPEEVGRGLKARIVHVDARNAPVNRDISRHAARKRGV